MYTTYILYSKKTCGYYVGSTSEKVQERLSRHNTKHKGYTSQTNDWEIIYEMQFFTVSEARKLELKIKKRGAKRYLEDLDNISGHEKFDDKKF